RGGPRMTMMSTAPAPVLHVSDLSVRYGPRTVVHDVDLALHAGETVALVGGSGAGKSTVAKAVAGLAAAHTGSVRLEADGTGHGGAGGLDLLSASAAERRAARRAVHLVMQDPYASLPPHMRVLDIVMEPLVIHRIGHRRERGEAARDALHAV